MILDRGRRFAAFTLARFRNRFRELRAAVTTRHVSGPRRIAGGPRDLAVLCLVRDGMVELRNFLRHHRRLGARHFVFLDNGSTDGTVGFLKNQGDVTLYQSALTFGKYEHALRRLLCRRHARHRWVLAADIDECFDYPASDRVSLARLLEYLDAHDYDAVVAHILDLFSADPILQIRNPVADDFRAAFPYFDLSDLVREPYESWFGSSNVLADPGVQIFWGGIRKSAFGLHDPLTKHPLFKLRGTMKVLTNAHDVRNARVADLTAVLYHYKFTAGFPARLRQASATVGNDARAINHQRKLDVLAARPDLTLKSPRAEKLRNADQLVALGFLQTSAAYNAWVEHDRTQG